ncbi:MAG: ribbon-helix-helix domain-containing protein [Lacipirellulaceae bacterium]
MDVELSTEHQAFLAEQVAAGVFASPSDGLGQAVELLRRREGMKAKLRLGLDDLESGRFVELDDVGLNAYFDQVAGSIDSDTAAP